MPKKTKPEYLTTSPTDEELSKKISDSEYQFISNVRTGDLNLFDLEKPQKTLFKKLRRKKIINKGFALIHPGLFISGDPDEEPDKPGLYFLFISAYPERYFDVKDWIINTQKKLSFSAYTTIGPYDFIMRITGNKQVIGDIKKDLRVKFSLSAEDGKEQKKSLMSVRVEKAYRYDRVRDFPETTQDIDIITTDHPAHRRFLASINEEIVFKRITKDAKKKYNDLREWGIVLGTRCLVDTPRLHSILAFILVRYSKVDSLMSILKNTTLSKNVIDAFTVIAPDAFGALLVCEFEGRGSNALSRYNRWMDEFYWGTDMTCLTFTVDSIIGESPDVYESSTTLRSAIDKYWTIEKGRVGVTLGPPVWYGKPVDDLPEPAFDKDCLLYHTVIIGGQGSGKTNTSLRLAKSVAAAGVKVGLLSFKGGESIAAVDIAKIGGSQLQEEEFLKSKDLISQLQQIAIVNVDKNYFDVAKHALSLAEDTRSKGGRSPLKYLLILDEIMNLKLEDGQTIQEVGELLGKTINKCRDNGVGIVILTQTFELPDKVGKIYNTCSNLLIHKIPDGDADSHLLASINNVMGMGTDIRKQLPRLPTGHLIAYLVDRDGSRPATPLVINTPLLKTE